MTRTCRRVSAGPVLRWGVALGLALGAAGATRADEPGPATSPGLAAPLGAADALAGEIDAARRPGRGRPPTSAPAPAPRATGSPADVAPAATGRGRTPRRPSEESVAQWLERFGHVDAQPRSRAR